MTDATNAARTDKLFELIRDIDVAMLVTHTDDGSLRSRPMATTTLEGGCDLWFLTDRESAKVVEIQDEKSVNVSFSDPKSQTFVSVTGNASVVDEPEIVDKVWSPSAQIWFPQGKRDPRITLIRVKPTAAEYWDAPRGVFVTFYELTKAIVTGERSDNEFGEHEKIDLES